MTQIKVEGKPQYGAFDVGERFGGFHIAATVPTSTQMVLDLPDGVTPDAAIQRLLDAGLIVDGRPVHDDYRPLGWPVKGPGPLSVPGDTFPLVMDADCPERGRWGARPTRLGILDTGLDGQHVAFEGKDVQGDLRDDHGHGTHCASTAASAWGIASDSAITMLNVLPGGSGSEAGIANGFRQLADAGCDVISASLGGSPSQVIDAAVQYARSRGALVVCAAGNGYDQGPPGSPARAATVSVYAVDRASRPASFTDGKAWATTGSQGVDITAAARGTRTGAMTMSGTSMAAPHVAGLLCLLRGAGLSPQACLDYLARHRPTVPAGCANGVLRLLADYGDNNGGEMDLSLVQARLDAIQGECDRDGLRYFEPTEDMDRLAMEAFGRDIQKSLGLCWEHAQQARIALGDV